MASGLYAALEEKKREMYTLSQKKKTAETLSTEVLLESFYLMRDMLMAVLLTTLF